MIISSNNNYIPDHINIWIKSNLERVSSGLGIHLGYSIIMHCCINREFLNSGRNEKTSGVLTDDLELKHAVHEGHPIVDPGETSTRTLHIATDDTAEKTTKILLQP